MKLWRHKKYSSKDSFHPWALIKGWLESPPCPHRATLRDQPLRYGSTGGERRSPAPAASPFLQQGLHSGKHRSPSQLNCDLMSDSLSLIIFSLLFIIKIKRSISSDKRKVAPGSPGQVNFYIKELLLDGFLAINSRPARLGILFRNNKYNRP